MLECYLPNKPAWPHSNRLCQPSASSHPQIIKLSSIAIVLSAMQARVASSRCNLRRGLATVGRVTHQGRIKDMSGGGKHRSGCLQTNRREGAAWWCTGALGAAMAVPDAPAEEVVDEGGRPSAATVHAGEAAALSRLRTRASWGREEREGSPLGPDTPSDLHAPP